MWNGSAFNGSVVSQSYFQLLQSYHVPSVPGLFMSQMSMFHVKYNNEGRQEFVQWLIILTFPHTSHR
jgi:hypothetical protein